MRLERRVGSGAVNEAAPAKKRQFARRAVERVPLAPGGEPPLPEGGGRRVQAAADRAQARVLIARQQARGGFRRQLRLDDAALELQRDGHDGQQHGQRREHDQAVHDKKEQPGRRARVPERVEGDCAHEPRRRGRDGGRASAGLTRDAEAQAGQAREQRVRKRGDHAAQREDQREPGRASLLKGAAVIGEVLRERKPEADHGGVNHPVDDAVELVAAGDVEVDQNRRLEGFFDDRGAGHGGPARAGHGIHEAVDGARHEDGDRRAPEEGDGQHVARLRLEAIEPEHDADVQGKRRHGHRGRDHEHTAPDRRGRQRQHRRRDEPEAGDQTALAHQDSR